MIVDNLSNSTNYYSLHPLFKKAFEYVKALNSEDLKTDTIDMEGNLLKIIIAQSEMKSATEAKLEVHKKFIDIQIPIAQKETFGWSSLCHLKNTDQEYDANTDIQFFNEKPSGYVSVLPGEFVIFFPQDGHAPLIGEGTSIKIIIKVAVL